MSERQESLFVFRNSLGTGEHEFYSFFWADNSNISHHYCLRHEEKKQSTIDILSIKHLTKHELLATTDLNHNTVSVLNTKTGKRLRSFKSDSPPVHIEWHPKDPELPAIFYKDKTLKLWNIKTGKIVQYNDDLDTH